MVRFREKGIAVALAVGLALALVVGLVYALAAGSRDIAGEAEALHSTHETIQATLVVRGQLELASYQASLVLQGAAVDQAALDGALERTRAALEIATAAQQAVVDSGEGAVGLRTAWQQYQAAAEALLSEIGTGNQLTTDGLEAAYSTLLEELTTIRDRLAANVAGARRSNSIIAAIGGFLAVLVIPAALIAAYYVLDRRRRRQHELEVSLQAERAAHDSREAFLTAVSHQLREPLWAVRGISRMLGNDEILMAQPRMADLHVLLAGELDDMNGLMDNLLTASRLEANALEYTMDSIEVREATRALTDSLDHRGASIYVAMDDGVVSADRRYLRQILWNLISNALKYGGPNIEVKGHADTDNYSIVVVDDGPGVPRSVEEHLFTRFVHTDQDSHNVGLGLSIVMALAVGMGGTAFYRREDGLTRFGVVLPTAIEPAIASALYEPPTMTPVTRAAG